MSDDVRRVVRSADPVRAGRRLLTDAERVVVVPSHVAARALGVARTTPTLARLARLGASGEGRSASAVTRRRLLRAACAEVFGDADALGYASRGAVAVTAWLRAGVPDGEPARLSERNARWWRVSRSYQRRLRSEGAIDPAEAPRLAAAAAGARHALAVLGYPSLDPDEVQLVDALAGPGSVVALPHCGDWTEAADAAAAALVGRGWVEVHVDDPAPDATIEAHRAATLEAEVRGALAVVKRALLEEQYQPDQLALVTRDPERYAGPLRSVARSYGVPLRLTRRVPLRQSPFGGWLATLLEALSDGLPFEATAMTLRHPFCALLDQVAFDRARCWRPRGLAAWRRALARSGPAARAQAALTLLAPLLAPRWRPRGVAVPSDADAWCSAVEASLGALLRPEAAGASAPFMALLQRGLGEGLAPSGDVDHASAIRALRDVLRAVTVPDDGAADPARPDRAAVPVVAPEALAGARLELVLVLGAAEGMLPAPVEDPPLFDAVDREELRAAGIPVPSPVDLALRERLALWGVWRATRRLWLAYPEQTGRDARLPSAFLSALSADVRPLDVRRPASAAERLARDVARPELPARATDTDPVLRSARHALHRERAREGSPLRDAFDGVLGHAVEAQGWRWSATQLTTFGQCRFRWLAQSAWGVREPIEAEAEVTPLLRGSLYHHALAEALRAAVGVRGEAARAAADAALEAAFETAERRTAARSVPHWRHLRHEHLQHLRELVRQTSFLPDEHQVLVLEGEFAGRWHGLEVVGRVDRVDRTPSGVMVIDYKTGSTPPLGARGFDADRLDLDLQLPLYQEVAAPRLVPGEPVAGARYFALGAMRTIARDPPDRRETEAFVARLKRDLAAGDFPVEPSDACRSCALEAACRKGPRLARKRDGAASAARELDGDER